MKWLAQLQRPLPAQKSTTGCFTDFPYVPLAHGSRKKLHHLLACTEGRVPCLSSWHDLPFWNGRSNSRCWGIADIKILAKVATDPLRPFSRGRRPLRPHCDPKANMRPANSLIGWLLERGVTRITAA